MIKLGKTMIKVPKSTKTPMTYSNSRVTTLLYKPHLLSFYFSCYENHKISTLIFREKLPFTQRYSTISWMADKISK